METDLAKLIAEMEAMWCDYSLAGFDITRPQLARILAALKRAEAMERAAISLTTGLEAWDSAAMSHDDVIHKRIAVNAEHEIRLSDLRALRQALAPAATKETTK